VKFADILKRQREFSDLFFDSSLFSDTDREQMTKSFALSLHSEVADLVSSINFKDHYQDRKMPDRTKILYESVDIVRYLMAIMNVWDITQEEFSDAFDDKDSYLHFRHSLSQKSWDGRPVAIIDMDDVLAEFRFAFFGWLSRTRGVSISYDCPEYYAASAVQDLGHNTEQLFKDFIAERQIRNIPIVQDAAYFMQSLRDMGYWVQILTARPADNPLCLFDTSRWLQMNDVYFDDVAFSGEKFRWIIQSKFAGHVALCVDDSPKHAAEFASHGLKTFSPRQPYNSVLLKQEGVIMVENLSQIIDNIRQEK
jgi:hypothetical protein